MSDDSTDRLTLPCLTPGQAQKEMTHNEALGVLDIAVQAAVIAVVATPPVAPVPGQCWIVAPSATGTFAGHDNDLAGWTVAGWRFLRAIDGMRAWVIDANAEARFTGGTWQVGEIAGTSLSLGGHSLLAAPVAAIADPAGGSTVDTQARTAIGTVLAALRHHGLVETA